jgi:mannose-6-phosphate isomerase-like protein (cupin superfamily)
MSDYTKLNIREVEDSARKFGMPDEMSARFASTALGLQKSGLSLQSLAPDSRGPFGHRHAEQEEIYVVVAGGGRIKLDDEVVELSQWDVVRIPPEVARQVESGPEGIEFLAYGAPRAPDDGMGDAEMLSEWWTD